MPALSFPTLKPCALLAALSLALAGCAPAPIYKAAADATSAGPDAVLAAPHNYRERDVIWAGRIIAVSNFSDHSELTVLAYPMDHSQRPELKRQSGSRFVAVYPGFIEPMNYVSGAPITIAGKFVGTRSYQSGQLRLILPLVSVAQSHRWSPQEMDAGHPHFQFGIGGGIGFH